jgi:hypothetical protein
VAGGKERRMGKKVKTNSRKPFLSSKQASSFHKFSPQNELASSNKLLSLAKKLVDILCGPAYN